MRTAAGLVLEDDDRGGQSISGVLRIHAEHVSHPSKPHPMGLTLCRKVLAKLHDGYISLSMDVNDLPHRDGPDDVNRIDLHNERVFMRVSGHMLTVSSSVYTYFIHFKDTLERSRWSRAIRDTLMGIHQRSRQDHRGWQHQMIRGTLHSCAMLGDESTLCTMMKSSPSINITDDFGDTPLHLAVLEGHEHVVDLLLEAGASATLVDVDGRNAIHLAIDLGRVSILQRLCGSVSARDMNAQTDPSGRSLLWRALLSEDDYEGDVSEHGVHTEGHVCSENTAESTLAGIIAVLCQAGVDPNAREASGITPLYFVAVRTRHELMNALLENGADPNLRSGTCGEMPLHACVRCNDLPTTMLLLAFGAYPNGRLTNTSSCSSSPSSSLTGFAAMAASAPLGSPLHEARSDEIAELLLHNGARILTTPKTCKCDSDVIEAHKWFAALPDVNLKVAALSKEWMKDDASLVCLACQERFSAFVRKHHCRRCARLVCRSCSTKKMLVVREPQRLCDGCFNSIRYSRRHTSELSSSPFKPKPKPWSRAKLLSVVAPATSPSPGAPALARSGPGYPIVTKETSESQILEQNSSSRSELQVLREQLDLAVDALEAINMKSHTPRTPHHHKHQHLVDVDSDADSNIHEHVRRRRSQIGEDPTR